MSLNFSTKASTLAVLRDNIVSARVLNLIYFTLDDWAKRNSKCLELIEEKLPQGLYIVRSSCLLEDSKNDSRAGQFLSLQNVKFENLSASIDKVIASYETPVPDDQILIQPMLKNVVRSGVAFTHDPVTCSPYFKINWANSHNTNIVTSGLSGRTWFMARNSEVQPPTEINGVVALMHELQNLFNGVPIDVEFAITKNSEGNETLWLLQARQLFLNETPESYQDQTKRIKKIEARVQLGMSKHPFLVGGKTVFGVMPDWNPAEIIGIRPKPLALSLYRELITDNIWAYQRYNYGYRNVRSVPLMQQFFGTPYIDVRASFNSFIPADLDDQLATKLVDYYIGQLSVQPSLHDKVEFEIVFSCAYLGLKNRLQQLNPDLFSASDKDAIATSLLNLTNKIIHPVEGLWISDAQKLEILQDRFHTLIESNLNPIEKIYWLLEDAKRYGTLPFAGLARAGFIAIQMLKSLALEGIITEEEYGLFLENVSTVSGELARDRRNLGKEVFLAKYGHLRPGAYDILSPRYDENPELYFDWTKKTKPEKKSRPFVLNASKMRALSEHLKKNGLNNDPENLLNFIHSGIKLREEAKFQFSKNLSEIISLIGKVGGSLGFSLEDMSFSNIFIFKDMYISAVDNKNTLKQEIKRGRAQYKETLRTALPPLIINPCDVWSFEWPEVKPNFITQKRITGKVVGANLHDSISGNIVFIPNADPGFDWLFSHEIAGLVTAWGGANSHMAIRAGEMGLPAVIGAGQELYKIWAESECIMIDCAANKVEILS